MTTEDTANSGREPSSITSESPEIHAHYTWTAEELLAARRLHGLHTFRRLFRYGMGLTVLIVFLSGCLAMLQTGPSFPVMMMLLVCLYVAFFRRPYQRWATKRQFQKRPDKAARVEWTFTSDRVVVTSSAGSKAENPWSTFAKAVLAPEGVLLYPINEVFYWIPRHAFESDEMFQQFVSLVRKSVSKTHHVGDK